MLNIVDPDEPGPDGDVTGAPADCSAGPKEGPSTLTGPAAPHLVGRFSPRGEFVYSGSRMTARFTGSGVAANIALPEGADTFNPAREPRVLTVKVDGVTSELAARPGRSRYVLAEGLDPTAVHEVEVRREFEANGGLARFEGFELTAGGKYEPARVRPRRIEVIGDSISCGYGVLGSDGSCPFTFATQRHSRTYAAIAAETLDAELSTVCWSGKGLSRNDDGDDGGQPSKKVAGTIADAMPEIFATTIPRGVPGGPEVALPYTFPKESAPQVVVVNLGTNDYLFGVDDATFVTRGRELVRTIRGKYPDSHIFFTLSTMISNTNGPEIRTRADASLRSIVEGSGDSRVYYMQFSEQRSARDGLGCDGHPSPTTQELTGRQLVRAIQSKTCW